MAGAKVSTSLRLTERQEQAIHREAKRLDISFGDVVRRILDEWIGRQNTEGLAGKVYKS